MCIMTVREGQHHSTVAQGCLHNLNTVISDLDMFSKLLESEGNILRAAQIEEVKDQLGYTANRLRQLYGDFVADRLNHEHLEQGHSPIELSDHVHSILRADIREAKAFETRSKVVEGDYSDYQHAHSPRDEFEVPHTPPFDDDSDGLAPATTVDANYELGVK